MGHAPLLAPASADRRRAQRSVIIAAVALGVKLALPSLAAGAQQLSLLWFVVGWVTTLSAVYAIHLAWRVAGRIDGTSDGRAITMARYGLTLGMASLAYVASTLITSSIDQVIGSQPY